MRVKCYGVVLSFILILTANPYLLYQDTEIRKGSLFEQSFNEPFEVCYYICYDGTLYRMTSHMPNAVYGHKSTIIDVLKRDGKTLKDVAIIMHNHFMYPWFSRADLKYLKYLRKNGFEGSFGIYLTPTKKVILWKE